MFSENAEGCDLSAFVACPDMLHEFSVVIPGMDVDDDTVYMDTD